MNETFPATKPGRSRQPARLSCLPSPSPSALPCGRSFRSSASRIKAELGLNETAVRPADRHADPHRQPGAHRARHLDRPLRRTPGLHRHDARGRSRDLPAGLRPDLRADAARRARRRPRRRLVRGRRRLCVALLSGRQARHGARHLRRRQCRRRRHQVRRAFRAARLGLADRRADLGGGARPHGRRLLVRAPRTIRSSASAASTGGAAQELSGANSRR